MNTLIDFKRLFNQSKYPSDLFEKYFDYQDKFYSSEIKLIKRELQEKVKDKDIDEEIYWMNMFNEFQVDFLQGTFQDIQNKTSLILLYTVFENNFKQLCKLLGDELKTPIAYTDLSGDDLNKCKKYLIKLCGLNDGIFETDCWKKIDCVRKIRNCVVHNGSDITMVLRNDKKIIDEFKNINGFTLVDNGFGLLKNDFLRMFIKIADDFFKLLVAELKMNQKSGFN